MVCNATGWNENVELGGKSLIISPDGHILREGGMKASAQITAVRWSDKAEVQRQFKSFTEESFPVSWRAKIRSAQACLTESEQRYRVGQRIILFRVEVSEPLPQVIERVEQARRLGDYLVVATDIDAASIAEEKYSEEQPLAAYAALGCVGAVFRMEEMDAAIEYRFRQCCCVVLL